MTDGLDPEARLVSLPPAADPAVSVIVLAWRLGEELLECVRGLAAQRDAPAFEVVIVQNGATHEARRAVKSVVGAVVVDLPQNVGFGGGCGAGAAAASGAALVFLNDDAVPEPDWLARLAERARRDDHPVAVGSLLIGDDGLVQEAGSRVLSWAGTVQLGRGSTLEEAEAAGLLRGRAVDYCSAAALWVDRAAFDAIGGFDELFSPAYFEDVDLQFRLKVAGGTVVVEPAAVAQHHSGASTDAIPLYREFLGHRNGVLFSARWRDALTTAPDADAPLDALVDVLPPDVSVVAPTAPEFHHPSSSAEWAAWLEARVRSGREALALAERRITDLEAEHRKLQGEHHELAQHSHALFLELQELRSRSLMDRVRDRLPGRRAGGGT